MSHKVNLMNPMLACDGYKIDHRRQYPAGTTRVFSNWTPRSSRIPGQNHVVTFGLQYFLDEYLIRRMQEHFFDRPREEIEQEYQWVMDNYVGPVAGQAVGTKHIAALHELGYVPLEFRALPEGTLCPLRVPMITVENTVSDFFWLTNYIETIMSCTIFPPSTAATIAYMYRQILNEAAERTGGNREFVNWQAHNFGFRGMAGFESACLADAGHLLSFTGSDTLPGIAFLQDYYYADGLISGSVFATEHAVMSCGGEENEMQTFNRLLDLYPVGIVSAVSDTWDLWNVILTILPRLKDKIMSRPGFKLVIRPDSGTPELIIAGDPSAPEGSPEHKGVVRLLYELFGGTKNAKGFIELDPHIGAIYGDSITVERCREICRRLEANGFASTNVVLGIGSYTYNYVTRDTLGFAMKATWAEVNGQGRPLFKDPKTDNGIKKSAKGRLAVKRNRDGVLTLIEEASYGQELNSELTPVWRNGQFIRRSTLSEIRNRLWPNS